MKAGHAAVASLTATGLLAKASEANDTPSYKRVKRSQADTKNDLSTVAAAAQPTKNGEPFDPSTLGQPQTGMEDSIVVKRTPSDNGQTPSDNGQTPSEDDPKKRAHRRRRAREDSRQDTERPSYRSTGGQSDNHNIEALQLKTLEKRRSGGSSGGGGGSSAGRGGGGGGSGSSSQSSSDCSSKDPTNTVCHSTTGTATGTQATATETSAARRNRGRMVAAVAGVAGGALVFARNLA